MLRGRYTSNGTMEEFPEYICPHCGESIQIVADASAGREQVYIEDCPVCCNPNKLRVEIDEDGEAYVQVIDD